MNNEFTFATPEQAKEMQYDLLKTRAGIETDLTKLTVAELKQMREQAELELKSLENMRETYEVADDTNPYADNITYNNVTSLKNDMNPQEWSDKKSQTEAAITVYAIEVAKRESNKSKPRPNP